jgi:hypothetical protein
MNEFYMKQQQEELRKREAMAQSGMLSWLRRIFNFVLHTL